MQSNRYPLSNIIGPREANDTLQPAHYAHLAFLTFTSVQRAYPTQKVNEEFALVAISGFHGSAISIAIEKLLHSTSL